MLLRDDDALPDPTRPYGRDRIAALRPDPGDPSRRARPPAGGCARRALREDPTHRPVFESPGALHRDARAAGRDTEDGDQDVRGPDRDGRRRLDGTDAPLAAANEALEHGAA